MPSRTLRAQGYKTTLCVYGMQPPQEFTYQTYDWESKQSKSNLWSYRRDIPNCDLGGPFTLIKYTDHRKAHAFAWRTGFDPWSGHYAYDYAGFLLDRPSSPTLAQIQDTANNIQVDVIRLLAHGSTLLSKASPTRSQASMTTALVELKRDGLPRLSSATLQALTTPKRPRIASLTKGAASDYLNGQFGWLPFVSDIRKLALSVMNAEKLLSQLDRDSGKVVRRKSGNRNQWTVVDESTTETEGYAGWPILITQAYSSVKPSKLFVHSRTVRAIWFSGAFVYHLPDNATQLGSLRRLAQQARYLYGLSIAPDTLWSVVPWSWLIGWFTNIGDVFSNMSDQVSNQQVMKYGYVMAHTVRTITTTATIYLADGSIATPSSVQVYEVKQRLPATPYGFDATWESFTGSQLAVLAALGLSRRL